MQTMQSPFGGFGMSQNPPSNDPNLSWQFFQNLSNATNNFNGNVENRRSSKRKTNSMELDESEPLRKKMHSLSFERENNRNPFGYSGNAANSAQQGFNYPSSSSVKIEAIDENDANLINSPSFLHELNGSYFTSEDDDDEEEDLNINGALIPFRTARSIIMEPHFRQQKEAFKRYLKNTDKNTLMAMLKKNGIVISLPKIMEFLNEEDEEEKEEKDKAPRIVEIFDDEDDMNQSNNVLIENEKMEVD
eukprot:TRINITY_DN14319_c0_g1_i2.p1 TRINITY_DN14319_c0_g1~~TRINITY_DN14319_c0_g1_i2.p1  ORF type:complete len:247 (-),score=97.24 TRINITY_DN14319_c0_g1_i2:10-750(-)